MCYFTLTTEKCNGKLRPSFKKEDNKVEATKWQCCKEDKTCLLGGGDCDNDEQCEGELVCGRDNCRNEFSIPGSDWDAKADCCTGIFHTHQPIYKY